MIYDIENKNIKAVLKNENIKLSESLKIQIDENFNKIKATGAHIWNGEILCVGEEDLTTSYPSILTVTGGNIDTKDIVNGNINVMHTIIRETLEELNIDLNDNQKILYNKIKYIYISERNQQPGITVFSKAKINMTAEEVQKFFKNYYHYLKNHNMELEFGRLHLLRKDPALDTLEKLKNPKRDWLIPLIKADINNYFKKKYTY